MDSFHLYFIDLQVNLSEQNFLFFYQRLIIYFNQTTHLAFPNSASTISNFPVQITLVSSNSILDTLQISLIYITNEFGLKIDPCGTPHMICCREDLIPPIWTNGTNHFHGKKRTLNDLESYTANIKYKNTASYMHYCVDQRWINSHFASHNGC